MKKLLLLLFVLSICVPVYSQTVVERGIDYEVRDLGGNQREMTIGVENFLDDDGKCKPVDLSVSDILPIWSAGMGFNEYYSKNRVRVLVDTVNGRFRIYPKRDDNTSYIEITSFNPTTISTQVINNKYLKIYKDTANVEYAFILSSRGFKILYTLKNANALNTTGGNYGKLDNRKLYFRTAGNLSRTGRQIKYNGNTIFTLPNATWWDSGDEDNRKEGNITESITGEEVELGIPDLTGAVYPVFIDPTLDIQGTGVVDTSLRETTDTGDSTGTSLYFKIETGTNERTLVGSFNFSALPADASISSATVYFDYFLYNTNPNGKTINIFRMLRPTWVASEAKWTLFKTGSAWNTPGARGLESDYTATGSASIVMPASYQVVSANVTTQVQWAQANSSEIWYWLMHWASGTTSGTDCYFRSTEATTGEKPKLSITYTSAGGNSPPTITINQPDGTSDVVTSGQSYNINYTLADTDDIVTASLYYDLDGSGLDGTLIASGRAEGTNVNYAWDTTGMAAGTYYVYGVVNDGTNPDVTDYSPGELTINAASGTTWWVSPTGNDTTGNGTAGSPYKTIQKGVDVAQAGDTVMVKDGTYTDTNNDDYVVLTKRSGSSGNIITIKAENKWGAIIDGENRTKGYGFIFGANDDYISIDGFEIQYLDETGVMINSDNNNITIVRNKIHDIGKLQTSQTYGQAGIYCGVGTYNITIDSNWLENIGRDGITTNHDHGIYIGSKTGVTRDNYVIKNNIFINKTSGWPVHLYTGSPGNNTTLTNVTIINNTFYKPNTTRDGQVIIATPIDTLLIQNNIFYQPRRMAVNMGIDCIGKTNITVRNNITDVGVMLGDASTGAPRECGATMSNNVLNTNPLLVDPVNGDFHLLSNSPAIDTGHATSSPSVDYYGNARPYNTIFDKGVHEYTINLATPSCGVDNTTYASGATITVTVDGGNSNTEEWIGLYVAANPDSSLSFQSNWQYLDGTKTEPLTPITYPVVLTFTAPNTSGTYDVRFFANNGYTNKLAASNTFTVTSSPNVPPVANNDSFIATRNVATSLNVLANDTDSDGTIDATVVVITQQPMLGTAGINAVTGIITYTSFVWVGGGTDTFKYTVADNDGGVSNQGTVTITIPPPSLPPGSIIESTWFGTTRREDTWQGGWK